MRYRLVRPLIVGVTSAALVIAFVGTVAAATSGTTYRVTIDNTTSGQPFTPPVLVTHDPSVSVFTVGEPASEGVVEIAENGNIMPLVESPTGAAGVHDVITGDGPVPPGMSATLEITANPGEVVSWVSMLICTNDGFTGLSGQELSVGTVETDSYETSTEMNTEDFADIVPPCQEIVGITSDESGTAMSNPALAEDGVIVPHPGITGDADLQVDPHGWTDPVASVTIEQVGMPDTAIAERGMPSAPLLTIVGLLALAGSVRLAALTVRRD